nr:polysaccharide lyase family 7 protein [uncultured Pseudomonas sp.]
MTVNLHGLTYSTTIDPSWDGKRFYFKAGMYVIDNEGPETEGGRVEMYSLDLQHAP